MSESEAFAQLATKHRRQLRAHCYRMLGSSAEADDLVQDVLLRAWRSLSTFEGKASLRTWLYQVATNACLSALRTRRARSLPEVLSAAARVGQHVGPRLERGQWIEPFVDDGAQHGESAILGRESLTLGFVVALQRLAPRQRALLLLCEVVGFEATEVAAMLKTTPAAVNSAIARARVTLARERVTRLEARRPSVAQQGLLRRYQTAWESGDIDGLVALLSEEATFSMPPIATWYRGKLGVAGVLAAHVFARGGRFKLTPTWASGGPAFFVEKASRTGRFRMLGVQVVRLGAGRVEAVTTFLGAGLARRLRAAGAPDVSGSGALRARRASASRRAR